MVTMLEIENNLTSSKLAHVSKSEKSPIKVFKSLIEKLERDFLIGFDKIIVGDYNRIIKSFRILHNSVLYGPLNVLDLEKIKPTEYLDNSVYAHEVLEQLKQKDVVDCCIEIPEEYNVSGRLWRKYCYGQELSTLKLATKEMREQVLEECRKTAEEMKALNVPKESLPKEGEIKRKLDRLHKKFGSQETKIPLYGDRIHRTLEALMSNYGLMDMDYSDKNVIINPRTEEIAIIDGYWSFVKR
jgi:hypothetical protein